MMWPLTTLEDPAFETINGLWKGKAEPFVRAKVIRNTNFRNDGILDFEDVADLEVEARSLLKKKLVKGDIIIERSGGGPKQPVGRVCLFDIHTTDNFSLSNFTTALRILDRKRFLPRFVCYYLLYLYRSGYTENLQRATTGIRNLDFSSYLKTEIPVPDLDEQIKISSILWKIQQAIAVETDLIRVSRELKAAVMRKLFTAGLNGEAQKETEIGLLPVSWEIKELREFVTIKSGGTPSREKPEYWNGGTIPWVKTGEVNYCIIEDTGEYITELGMENSAAKIFPKGTVLMAMYGQGVTRAKVALLGLDATTNQACAAIFPDSSVSSVFLYHFLEYQYEKIREMGHGANQKNLNTDIIKAIKCPVPQPDEQTKIAKYLDVLNADLTVREKKSDALKDLFQSTLAKLMSGTICLTDFDIDTTCLESQGAAA